MVSPAAMMSRACKKLMRPSGPMGTSVCAVSGISNNSQVEHVPRAEGQPLLPVGAFDRGGDGERKVGPAAGARPAGAGEALSAAGKKTSARGEEQEAGDPTAIAIAVHN